MFFFCCRRWLRTWVFLLAWLVCGLSGAAVSGAEPPRAQGYLEAIRFDPATREIEASGWAIPGHPGAFMTYLTLRLDDEVVYRGRMDRSERPDVAAALHRPDWLSSGFHIRFPLSPFQASGLKAVQASMRMSDGEVLNLDLMPSARQLELTASPAPPWRMGLGLLAFGLPLLVWVLGFWRAPQPAPLKPHLMPSETVFLASVLTAFLLLVGLGLSGSSLGLGLASDPIAQHDDVRLLGRYQPVRSDEWETITPMAISQSQTSPHWPTVNPLLGAEGENMLVIGMTGIPVAHVSAFAKPATWGFLLLDLRRALAWYWWFPFFACFLALWGVLVRLVGLDWRWAAPLSLSFAAAPYSVVYSGWPAYTAFFPLAAMWLADAVLSTRRLGWAVSGALALGACLAGFVLVLYPGWQISLAYLLLPLAGVLAWGRRQNYRFGRVQWLALGLSLAFAALILGGWWLDARDAVQAMKSTVYPGQRASEVGGDIDPWFLVKGLTSVVTMYASPDLANPSDTGSFVFLLVPAMLAWGWRSYQGRRLDGVGLVLLGYIGWVLAYMYLGFPPLLARLSLWSSSTSYRQDLGLGLAQTFLLAQLCRSVVTGPTPAPVQSQTKAALVLAVGLAGLTGWNLSQIPQPIASLLTPGFWWMSCALMGGAAYLLLSFRMQALVLLYAGWMLAAALPFNPLTLSLSRLELSQQLDQHLRSDPSASHRVAVLGPRIWSMTLPANGVPVVNSVFYYPQFGLWKKLDPDAAQHRVYNRYQRLLLVVRALPEGDSYRIESPRLDEVRLIVDPARFDFRLLGATEVMAAPTDGPKLQSNPSLRVLSRSPAWWLLAVAPELSAAKMRQSEP